VPTSSSRPKPTEGHAKAALEQLRIRGGGLGRHGRWDEPGLARCRRGQSSSRIQSLQRRLAFDRNQLVVWTGAASRQVPVVSTIGIERKVQGGREGVWINSWISEGLKCKMATMYERTVA
jgi:hypothetical protein